MGAGVGYAQAVGSDAIDHGVLFDLTGSTGIDAQWALRGRLSYALHPQAQPMHVAIAAGELVYVLDVVEFVPYAGLGAGGILRVQGSERSAAPAVHLVGGVDYLLSRSWTVEFDARAHVLVTELSRDPLYWALTVSAVLMLDP